MRLLRPHGVLCSNEKHVVFFTKVAIVLETTQKRANLQGTEQESACKVNAAMSALSVAPSVRHGAVRQGAGRSELTFQHFNSPLLKGSQNERSSLPVPRRP